MLLTRVVILYALLCGTSLLSASNGGGVDLTPLGAAPPVPTFFPAAGTGACPYSVTLTDSDPGATIFFTTDGTEPTLNSARTTGGPIGVSASRTIKAIAANLSGASASVAQNYVCGDFTSLTLTIQTGSDDARADSALQAILATNTGTTTWCLKHSDNGTFQSCAKQQPGVVWDPLSTNTSNVTPAAPIPVDAFTSLTIQLMQFPRGLETDDNWDLQSLTLTANVSNASPNFPRSATIMGLSGSDPPGPGTCFARFKHPAGPLSTVVFPMKFIGPFPPPVKVMDSDGPHEAPYCK